MKASPLENRDTHSLQLTHKMRLSFSLPLFSLFLLLWNWCYWLFFCFWNWSSPRFLLGSCWVPGPSRVCWHTFIPPSHGQWKGRADSLQKLELTKHLEKKVSQRVSHLFLSQSATHFACKGGAAKLKMMHCLQWQPLKSYNFSKSHWAEDNSSSDNRMNSPDGALLSPSGLACLQPQAPSSFCFPFHILYHPFPRYFPLISLKFWFYFLFFTP